MILNKAEKSSKQIKKCLSMSFFFNQQLIERTRQRRAMLNEKLGKTPDPAPRKRVLEDTTNQQPIRKPVDDGNI